MSSIIVLLKNYSQKVYILQSLIVEQIIQMGNCCTQEEPMVTTRTTRSYQLPGFNSTPFPERVQLLSRYFQYERQGKKKVAWDKLDSLDGIVKLFYKGQDYLHGLGERVAAWLPNIVEFRTHTDCYAHFTDENVYDLLYPFRSLKNLKILKIHQFPMSQRTMSMIAQNFSSLQSLSIGKISIGDQGADAIVQWMKNLKQLDVHSCGLTNEGVLNIARNMKNLKKLTIWGNKTSQNCDQEIKQLSLLNKW